ncbi:MarR family transcriptional regulator [Amylibacter sp. SFDW26]|uniref:MarR family winged helix-turn-helix transcriptional regulator n=1 Tax=Amylibacter sp. SFDW26 TaxID=2652722 RepID=UPI0012624F6B|nr:MarR family transcriptional regulator [Amylibacter sp. SFDW26]KAB7614606.1 MarR family transcriptional regulator [Amylibacter sp. SFDW26]
MSDATTEDSLTIALFSEIMTSDQLIRAQLSKALPKGMELSHFSVLNHLAHQGGERSPAQLARLFSVTKGAMTNTLTKLDLAGYVHIRPDWDDARKKKVALSAAGRLARDQAVKAVEPVFDDVIKRLGTDKIKTILPILRELRGALN